MGILRTDRVSGLGGAKNQRIILCGVKFTSSGALDMNLDGALDYWHK